MKRFSTRRVGALAVLSLTGAALATVAPAIAATGALTYTCGLPLNNSTTFSMNTDTNAPSKIQVNQVVKPKLTITVVLPAAFINGLKNQGGFTAIAGKSGTATITTNGVATPVSVTFPKKAFPASGPMTVLETGTLPATSLPNEGTITLKPGEVDLTLTASGSFSTDIAATCPLPAAGANSVIDTIAVTNSAPPPPPPPPPAKVASGIGVRASYAKAKRALTVLTRVIEKGKSTVPTGSVRVGLRRNGVFKQAIVLKLRSGFAKPVFKNIGKGSYTIIVTYYGSKTVKASRTTRNFKVG
jgi:hypothetical protein